MPTLGVEIEMAVINKQTGTSHLVDQYFKNLQQIRHERTATSLEIQGNRHIALLSRGVVSSVDNGFNNLESSIGPIPDSKNNLTLLHKAINLELSEVLEALAMENSTVVNFSQHPFREITQEFYQKARAPKPIYNYWVNQRNWNHMAGIDAKAQNGPTTGTSFSRAISDLNVLLGLSPALIALYGNSPFVNGKKTALKENRQTLWPQMFSSSRFSGDHKLHQFPSRPFHSLRDYFHWMFGPGTQMQTIGTGGGTYKKPKELLEVEGNPSLFEFLRGTKWPVKSINETTTHTAIHGEKRTVDPSMHHLEFLQFSQSLDARIRFELNSDAMPLELFLKALDDNQPLEEMFDQYSKYVYIEGRAAGSNFPDQELSHLSNPDIARSVMISVSALQDGLLRNQEESRKIVEKYGWQNLRHLREAAIRDGLQGSHAGYTLMDLAHETLELALSALNDKERWMLAYPFHVLDTKENGADRALKSFDCTTGSTLHRIKQLTLQRKVISPKDLY